MNFKSFKFAVSIVITIAFIFGFCGCSKLAQNLNQTFTLQTPAQTFTIPPIPNIVASLDTMPTVQGSFSYNIDSFIKANTGNVLSISNLNMVKISSCVLSLSDATPASNFQDFQYATIAFHSAANSTPFVLSANPPDVYASILTLTPTDTTGNLKTYMTGNSFNFSMTGAMRRGTADTLHCSVVFTFSINVQG
jgi:hypothetical protein